MICERMELISNDCWVWLRSQWMASGHRGARGPSAVSHVMLVNNVVIAPVRSLYTAAHIVSVTLATRDSATCRRVHVSPCYVVTL